MTYEELLSIAQSWIGFLDTNESGFYHNLSALSVFSMMFYRDDKEEPEW